MEDEGANPRERGSPYSPSKALEEEEQMDWTANLHGVKPLYNEPPSTQEEEGAPNIEQQQQADVLDVPPAGPDVPAEGVGGAGGGGAGDVQQRVKNYLQSCKEKNVAEIKKRMGDDIITYNAISSQNRKSSAAANLLGGEKKMSPALSSLVEIGDGRILSGGLQTAISTKRIVCTSFDKEWRCLRCGIHGQEPAFKIRGRPTAPVRYRL
jgi:hypothetical protein